VSGDLDRGLTLYDSAIDNLHQAGNITDLAVALASLAVFFNHIERPEIAATLYGTTTRISANVPGIRPSALARVRSALGEALFQHLAAIGAEMEPAAAVQYAHHQIQLARR
jgi:hypothetical protein